MIDKVYCENCNKFVKYTTNKVIDSYVRVDGVGITYDELIDTCSICGRSDCISQKSSDYNIKKAHRAYMRGLLVQKRFKKFFKRFWHDLRRFKF
jgi:hypothetical protein